MSALTRLSDGVVDAILSPALWLSVAVAVVCSVVFYAWRGGGMRQFGRDVVASLIGFGAGQLAGAYLQIDLLLLGQVQVLAGIVGAVVGLFLGRLVWREGAKVT
jgi:vacuolar-type H+-ATPase subunit I/STV1